ncbi:MAG TPA: hypothetical protein VGC92_04730 [Phenylobacterium sp.]
MTQARKIRPRQGGAEVVDFDAALLAACPAQARADLIAEAAMLAEAFAPEGREEELRAMANALARDTCGAGRDRPHARLLAAALRKLADRPRA